jgi:hypothetical protein
VTDLTAGTCVLAANQAGNAEYAAAAQVTQSISVANALESQTITFGTAPSLALDGTATVSATASSGLSVTYSSTTSSVCTVDSSTGLVTDLTTGTCTIAANQAGNSDFAAAAQVTQSISVASKASVATYSVTETFKEPNTQPDNTIFTGIFTYDPNTNTVSNLSGALTESMTQYGLSSTPEMTAVALNYQLSSVSDGNGGALVTSFALNTTNVFDVGGFATGGTKYYGYSSGATNPSRGGTGNAYATIDVDLSDPVNTLTSTQINLLAYADCTSQGMMGSDCMTGIEDGGTMGGYPLSETITQITGTTAQAITFAAAPSLDIGSTATVSATASSNLAVTYSSLTPAVCYVYQHAGVVAVVQGNSAGATCTIAADQYGNSEYAPATRATQSIPVGATSVPSAQWVQSAAGAANTGYNIYYASTLDAAGNVYAAGKIYGTGTFNFGNGVTAAGQIPSGFSVLVVKYNSSGQAQWAQTLSAGSSNSTYYAVVVDSSGNVYASGAINGTGTFGFGNGVTAAGPIGGSGAAGDNLVLVKYNSSGTAQWARTVAGSSSSAYNSVAVDSTGNVYAVGTVFGSTSYDFGNGQTVTAPYASGSNAVLVKYDTNGNAQWIQYPSAAANLSEFESVVVDSGNNIIVGGDVYTNGSYTFGSGNVSGGFATGYNALLVKYNASGTVQWADITPTASQGNFFNSIAVDTSNNIYAAGVIKKNGAFDFGNSVTVTGSNSSGNNALLVKYNLSGTAQWAISVSSGSNTSTFKANAVDGAGNVYVAGYVYDVSTYDFGNNVTVQGVLASEADPVVLKYNSSGVAQWIKSAVSETNGSDFNAVSVATDGSGNIYAAGAVTNTGIVDFGNYVSVTGSTATNANLILVNYK